MKRFVVILLALVMVLALALVGCAKEAEAPTPTQPQEVEQTAEPSSDEDEVPVDLGIPDGPWAVAYSAISEEELQEKLDTTLYVLCTFRFLSNPYFATIDEGSRVFCDYLDSIGQKYSYECVSNEGSSDTQIDQISAFLAKANGNGIIFCDPNESAITETIAEMVTEAGCYIGTTWNKDADVVVSDYDGWVMHTALSETETMYNMSKAMFAEFETPNQGNIFACQGLLGNTANQNRFTGLEKALAETPGVKLAYTQDCGWSADTAMSTVETWLAGTTDVDAIWCANDNMAVGAISALDAKGLKGEVLVGGFNGIEGAVQNIIDGNMYATVDCQGWMQGGYTLAICYDAWLGKLDVTKLPEECRMFGTGYTVITSENAQEFYDEFYAGTPVLDFENAWVKFMVADFPS